MKLAIERETGDAVDAVEDRVAVQLPLLPGDQIELLPTDPSERRAQLLAARGPGRPPGALNRSTKAWREHLLRKHRSPLEVLAETYSRPVQDLATELGCTKLEAFQLQQKAATELAPYLHGKMPTEIELNGAGLVQLTINTGLEGAAIPLASGDLTIDATIIENQALSGDDDAKV